MALKTDYVDDELAISMGGKRQFNIVDSNGNILYENVHIEDTSKYSTVGDDFGAEDINATNDTINQLNSDLTRITSFYTSSNSGGSTTAPANTNTIINTTQTLTKGRYIVYTEIRTSVSGSLCMGININVGSSTLARHQSQVDSHITGKAFSFTSLIELPSDSALKLSIYPSADCTIAQNNAVMKLIKLA